MQHATLHSTLAILIDVSPVLCYLSLILEYHFTFLSFLSDSSYIKYLYVISQLSNVCGFFKFFNYIFSFVFPLG